MGNIEIFSLQIHIFVTNLEIHTFLHQNRKHVAQHIFQKNLYCTPNPSVKMSANEIFSLGKALMMAKS